MRTKKLFNFLRTVAFASLICTLIVTGVMMVYSATPGEKSAQQSNQVADSIKDTFDIEEEKVESARVQLSEIITGFVGEEYTPTVKFFPAETTDKEVTFTSSNPNAIEVTAEGKLKLKAAGKYKVTVALKNNPSVKHTATMTCYGTHPDKITSVSLWQTDYKAGTSQPFYLKDQDGNKLLLDMFNPTGYKKDALSFTSSNILPLKVGNASVKFTIKRNLGNKNYTVKSFENALTINVTNNPNYVQPQKLVLANDGVYDLKLGEEMLFADLVKEVQPQGADKALLSYKITDNKNNAVQKLTEENFSAQKVGTAKVLITTKYNPNIQKEVTINVFNPPPTKLSVHGVTNGRAQYKKTYTLRAFGDDNYVDNITWSIVKGTGTIDPETGKLRGLELGKKVVVRATYTDPDTPDAPELYADYTIRAVMYEDFAASMRKLIGHFLLFAVIGFGLAYTYVLWIKPRFLALPLALASGFGLSVVSEALQLPTVTTGRVAAWSDVVIDFLGSSLGVVVGFALLLLILLAFRISKARDDFKRAFDAVSVGTVFRSTESPKLQTLLSPDYVKRSRRKNKNVKTDDLSACVAADKQDGTTE